MNNLQVLFQIGQSIYCLNSQIIVLSLKLKVMSSYTDCDVADDIFFESISFSFQIENLKQIPLIPDSIRPFVHRIK